MLTEPPARCFAGEMTLLWKSGQTMSYGYDGDGKRLRAAWSDPALPETRFLWDVGFALPELALERDGAGGLRRYLYGLDLISITQGSASSYYHHDGIGSVVNLTSSTGATQWTYDYEPFGTPRSVRAGTSPGPLNQTLFAGEYLDDTALYHLRARQYDPTTGRFLSVDPLPPSISDPYIASYVYADNRPTALVDPSGLGAVLGTGGDVPRGVSGCPLCERLGGWARYSITPKIVGTRGLRSSFDKHAKDWFGRTVQWKRDASAWQRLAELVTQGGRGFQWRLTRGHSGPDAVGSIMEIDGRPVAVFFWNKNHPRAGELAAVWTKFDAAVLRAISREAARR